MYNFLRTFCKILRLVVKNIFLQSFIKFREQVIASGKEIKIFSIYCSMKVEEIIFFKWEVRVTNFFSVNYKNLLKI